ncbi:beta-galactosidase [Brachybacterium hainanense]|uniref:Beta-galactosidase n=1 Tax=Brachybacterium hainanense TaxID=1541174 RepID=A0ABV6R9H3_9MICO
MTADPRLPARFPYGGDWCPEQWPAEVREADLDALQAIGVNTVTLGVFVWTQLHPAPGVYDLSLLEEIIEPVRRRGMQIVLATPTGAHPAWMARTQEVTRVDDQGRRRLFGVRHNSCPTSPAFRAAAAEIAGRIAERFGDLEGLVAWHIGNEYSGLCYCGSCAAAFRVWLQRKYGTIEELNRRWYTLFWNHTMTSFEDIVPPSALSEHWNGPAYTAFQIITLDYRRFQSEALLECFRLEKEAIRRHSPDVPVTANFMGFYKDIDYRRWAEDLDIISWDNYPRIGHGPARVALAHDLMRGLAPGKPLWLMEQTPSQTAWRPDNPLQEPGLLRLRTWQAIAHGADATLFFQMRASRGASEKFHGAILNHAARTDTRVVREVAQIGAEVAAARELAGTRPRNRVAVCVDWDAWWSLEMSDGPTRRVVYVDEIARFHEDLFDRGIGVDVVSPDADLAGYALILAPVLFVAGPERAANLARAVAAGAHLVTGFLSGRVDEDDQAPILDVPGHLAALCGVRVDETDSQVEGVTREIRWADGTITSADTVFDLVTPVDAEVRAAYADGFYAGSAAVTVREAGPGRVWYVGARLDAAGLRQLWDEVLGAPALAGIAAPRRPGLEQVERCRADASAPSYRFLLAHDGEHEVVLEEPATDLLSGQALPAGMRMRLAAPEVRVLRTAGDRT